MAGTNGHLTFGKIVERASSVLEAYLQYPPSVHAVSMDDGQNGCTLTLRNSTNATLVCPVCKRQSTFWQARKCTESSPSPRPPSPPAVAQSTVQAAAAIVRAPANGLPTSTRSLRMFRSPPTERRKHSEVSRVDDGPNFAELFTSTCALLGKQTRRGHHRRYLFARLPPTLAVPITQCVEVPHWLLLSDTCDDPVPCLLRVHRSFAFWLLQSPFAHLLLLLTPWVGNGGYAHRIVCVMYVRECNIER